MVDPISILAAFCALISASHALLEWWNHFREKSHKIGKSDEPDGNMFGWLLGLWQKYNRTASIMGRILQMRLNDNSINVLLLQDLEPLRSKLIMIQSGIKQLPSFNTPLEEDDDTRSLAFMKFRQIAAEVKGMQSAAEAVLARLCGDIATPIKEKLVATEIEVLSNRAPQRRFCDGAKVFQSGEKDETYLCTLAEEFPSKSNWGYICPTCGLEVGYYPAIRLSHSLKALDSSVLLTASHLVACRWRELRAFYRCLPCYKKRKIIDFSSALAFERHMEQHPNFTMMKEEDEDREISVLERKEGEFLQESTPTIEQSETIFKQANPIEQPGTPLTIREAASLSESTSESKHHKSGSGAQESASTINQTDRVESLFGQGFHSKLADRTRTARKSVEHPGQFTPRIPPQTTTRHTEGDGLGPIPGSFPDSAPASVTPAKAECGGTSIHELPSTLPNALSTEESEYSGGRSLSSNIYDEAPATLPSELPATSSLIDYSIPKRPEFDIPDRSSVSQIHIARKAIPSTPKDTINPRIPDRPAPAVPMEGELTVSPPRTRSPLPAKASVTVRPPVPAIPSLLATSSANHYEDEALQRPTMLSAREYSVEGSGTNFTEEISGLQPSLEFQSTHQTNQLITRLQNITSIPDQQTSKRQDVVDQSPFEKPALIHKKSSRPPSHQDPSDHMQSRRQSLQSTTDKLFQTTDATTATKSQEETLGRPRERWERVDRAYRCMVDGNCVLKQRDMPQDKWIYHPNGWSKTINREKKWARMDSRSKEIEYL